MNHISGLVKKPGLQFGRFSRRYSLLKCKVPIVSPLRSLHSLSRRNGIRPRLISHFGKFNFKPSYSTNVCNQANIPKKYDQRKQAVDGNTAAAYVAYGLSDTAIIYPITPSSNMGESCDMWSANGKRNIFDNSVQVTQMQSEAGAAGAMHGALAGGALCSTFTSSQGLLLMIPNIYKMAGELLPGVFHVAARAVAGQALSIFGDHSDVMATRPTGAAILASGTVQEAMDMATVAHLSSLRCSLPFIHFFDGFRTSHETNTIHTIDYPVLKSLFDMDSLKRFRMSAMTPSNPHMRGTSQGPDVYFQLVERSEPYYKAAPNEVQSVMNDLCSVTGRKYKLFDYVGHPDATEVLIMMGSGTSAAEGAVHELNRNGAKTGLIKVRLYRPFSADHFLKALPKSVRSVGVLDRTKEPGSIGEPLLLDVVSTVRNQLREGTPSCVQGIRYGLGSKEFTPAMAMAVFSTLKEKAKTGDSGIMVPDNGLTVGITDDISHTSISVDSESGFRKDSAILPTGTKQCILWGFGSDGTVGATKSLVKMATETKDAALYGQVYSAIDAHKAGGLTRTFLRIAPEPFEAPYEVQTADYVAVHRQAYAAKYGDVLIERLKPGGLVVFNAPWRTVSDLEVNLPNELKRELARKKAEIYSIDANTIAVDSGLKANQVNTVMNSALARLVLAGNENPLMDSTMLLDMLLSQVEKQFGSKGKHIVTSNQNSIRNAWHSLRHIDIESVATQWSNLERPRWSMPDPTGKTVVGAFAENSSNDDELLLAPPVSDTDKFVADVVRPILQLKGDDLPLSSFQPRGWLPPGTSAAEKRDIALDTPIWLEEKCTQCNICALACPHAAIRPFLLNKTAVDDATNSGVLEKDAKLLNCIDITGKKDLKYLLQVSPSDCTGCSLCAEVCPDKALRMAPVESKRNSNEMKVWHYLTKSNIDESPAPVKGKVIKGKTTASVKKPQRGLRNTIIGSQHMTPLLEFPGACQGCPQPVYLRLLTQLFGERLVVANATGCSSIWGASYPFNPYTSTKDSKGNNRGPAWANSLFEDNAEYGYGMWLAYEARREALRNKMEKFVSEHFSTNDILRDATVNDQTVNQVQELWGTMVEETRNCLNVWDDKEKSSIVCDKMGELLTQFEVVFGIVTRQLEGEKVNLESYFNSPLLSQIESIQPLLSLLSSISIDKDVIVKPSQWIVGGDGWAYDIGFGGLDHVLASGADVNVLVLDSEVYSNTGGQTSKATPRSAIARFSALGKGTAKKDLGLWAMLRGDVYVASVAVGADMSQTLKAIAEAEKYAGPSLIIAYTTCNEHGLKEGPDKNFAEMKKATECGYWPLYRYNPLGKGRRRAGSKTIGSSLTIDSPEPDSKKLEEFLRGEKRFSKTYALAEKDEIATTKIKGLLKDIVLRHKRLLVLGDSDALLKMKADYNDGKSEEKPPPSIDTATDNVPPSSLDLIPMGISYSDPSQTPVTGGLPKKMKSLEVHEEAVENNAPMYPLFPRASVCLNSRLEDPACIECVESCPQGSIYMATAGDRELPFFTGGEDDCDGCTRCVEKCPHFVVTHVDALDDPENPLVTLAVEKGRAEKEGLKGGVKVNVLDMEGKSLGVFELEDVHSKPDSFGMNIAIRVPSSIASKLFTVSTVNS